MYETMSKIVNGALTHMISFLTVSDYSVSDENDVIILTITFRKES